MKQQCRVCVEKIDYCDSCAIVKNPFKNAGYCDEDCYHISLILQSRVVNAITPVEALAQLREHNIENKQLQQSLQKHYESMLQDVVVIEEVVPSEDVEVVIDENEDMTISENE